MALNNTHSTNKTHHLLDWRNWVKGLMAAAIGGAANAITLIIVDPFNFNLQEGLSKLMSVTIVNATVAIALYLKQSPLPQEKE